jgi:hypothetical protein
VASDETVYILDQVTPKPGRAQEFMKSYVEHYVPGAEARGMKRAFTWVTPPVWLDNQTNTLFFIWSVKGTAGWWATQMAARLDPSFVIDWWRSAEPMIETRRRYCLADVSDVASLTHV